MRIVTESELPTIFFNTIGLKDRHTLGLSCSGHMSTMPVTRDSTMQNSESMPMVTSMKKNTTAHTEPPGSFNTTLKMIMMAVILKIGKIMKKKMMVLIF